MHFFDLKNFLQTGFTFMYVCVTVDSEHHGSCESNYSYCQNFQWSSSALVDHILIDQLLILDNVLSECIIHIIDHQIYCYIRVPLHIDHLPCGITKDDVLSVLIHLLSWVYVYKQMCNDYIVCIAIPIFTTSLKFLCLLLLSLFYICR